MTTNTWVIGNQSVVGALTPGVKTPIVLALPGNSTLVRFQIRNTLYHGAQDGIGVNAIGPVAVQWLINYARVASPSKQVFKSTRRVPSDSTALYDPATLQRVYSQTLCAGDDELGCNQSTAHGKHSDPNLGSVTLNCTVYMFAGGLAVPPVGLMEWEFAALYTTLP
jgi:hypothetical protein